MVFSGAVAGVGCWADYQWPIHRAVFEMAVYSLLVLGLPMIGLRSDRRRPKFTLAVCSMIVAHLFALILFRSIFPFRTVLEIAPLILIEGALLFALALKILDGRVS